MCSSLSPGPKHVHLEATRRWFTAHRGDGWATCPLTEAGFVRVSCNPSAVQHTVTHSEAIALLQRLRRLESHSFWPLDRSVADLPREIVSRLQGYRQITDAVCWPPQYNAVEPWPRSTAGSHGSSTSVNATRFE